jgi:HEAT repeat protein
MSDPMTCGSCGRYLVVGGRFCAFCGKPVAEAAPAAGEKEEPYEGRTPSQWIDALRANEPDAGDVLGAIGKPAVPALTRALKDKAPLVRALSASILWGMGEQASSAAPALKELLTDADPVVRLRGAQALSRIEPGFEGSLRTLITSLTDKANFAREESARILASLGNAAKPAVPALKAASKDKNAAVRKAVKDALRMIEG